MNALIITKYVVRLIFACLQTLKQTVFIVQTWLWQAYQVTALCTGTLGRTRDG